MYVFINARRNDDRDGHATLICKGKFNGRRKQAENLAYDKRVSACFQKSAMANAEVVMELARDFIAHKSAKHSDACKLMHYDNLSAHVDNKTQQSFLGWKITHVFFAKRNNRICPTDRCCLWVIFELHPRKYFGHVDYGGG